MSLCACCLLLATTYVAASPPLTATQTGRPAVRVQLKVSAETDFRSSIYESLKDELRSIPGVAVADSDPDYIISVIALKVVNESRRDVGATFSVLITEPLEKRVEDFSSRQLSSDASQQLAMLLGGAVKPRAHWVETAAGGDLVRVCRDIARAFATDVLAEPAKVQ